MAERRFFSGDSIDQAVLEAAGHYGLLPEELAYREVDKKHGFLRRRVKAVISVDPAAPRRAPGETPPRAAVAAPSRPEPAPATASLRPPAAAGAEPRPPAATAPPVAPVEGPRAEDPPATAEATPVAGAEAFPSAPAEPERAERIPGSPRPARQQEAPGPAAEPSSDGGAKAPPAHREPPAPVATRPMADAESVRRAEEAVDRLLELADLDIQPRGQAAGSVVWVELEGAETERALEDEGALLELLEYLGSRLLRGEEDVPAVRVDCGGVRRRRLESLAREARRLGEEVRRTGEPAWTESLPAADRREVHMAIEKLGGLETESEGRGRDKRVRIFSAEV